MPEYRWSCQSCGKANSAESDACFFCGCPAAANGETLDNWKVAEGRKPELPSEGNFSLTSLFSTHETGNCPACRMLMYLSDKQCPHCGLVQTEDQRLAFFEEYENRKHRAMWQGVIFVTIFLILSTIIFWLVDLPGG